MAPQERAKLRRDLICHAHNSHDTTPENWNPEEMSKFDKLKGDSPWQKYRWAAKEEWSKFEKQGRELDKAKGDATRNAKKAKGESARAGRMNSQIDSLM